MRERDNIYIYNIYIFVNGENQNGLNNKTEWLYHIIIILVKPRLEIQNGLNQWLYPPNCLRELEIVGFKMGEESFKWVIPYKPSMGKLRDGQCV